MFATFSTTLFSEPLRMLKIFVRHLSLIVSSTAVCHIHHFKHRFHPCDKENRIVAKTFENIITEPGCLRCWRWFVGPTALHFYFGQPVKSKTYRLHFLQGVVRRYQFLLYILALECCNHKCGQVLSCSSSSQISRACDSQARHCSGDINMAVKRNYFFECLLGSIAY